LRTEHIPNGTKDVPHKRFQLEGSLADNDPQAIGDYLRNAFAMLAVMVSTGSGIEGGEFRSGVEPFAVCVMAHMGEVILCNRSQSRIFRLS